MFFFVLSVLLCSNSNQDHKQTKKFYLFFSFRFFCFVSLLCLLVFIRCFLLLFMFVFILPFWMFQWCWWVFKKWNNNEEPTKKVIFPYIDGFYNDFCLFVSVFFRFVFFSIFLFISVFFLPKNRFCPKYQIKMMMMIYTPLIPKMYIFSECIMWVDVSTTSSPECRINNTHHQW